MATLCLRTKELQPDVELVVNAPAAAKENLHCPNDAVLNEAWTHTSHIKNNNDVDSNNIRNGTSLSGSTSVHENAFLPYSTLNDISTPPQGDDVLFGAVTKQRWPGNAFFNKLVSRHRDSGDLNASAKAVMQSVRENGGRFFYCQVMNGRVQHQLCEEAQILKYILRHLHNAARTKLGTQSHNSAIFLHALYTTPESSSTPQVTPPPLVFEAAINATTANHVNATSSSTSSTTSVNNHHSTTIDRCNNNNNNSQTVAKRPPRTKQVAVPKKKASTAKHTIATATAPASSNTSPSYKKSSWNYSYQKQPRSDSIASQTSSSSHSSTDADVDVTMKDSKDALDLAKIPPRSYRSSRVASAEAQAAEDFFFDLPKGVTVRASGKWQAQIYFCGQSRYIGVFENSKAAAVAYNAAHLELSKYKKKCTTRGEEAARIFHQVRKVANAAVYEMIKRQKQVKQPWNPPATAPPAAPTTRNAATAASNIDKAASPDETTSSNLSENRDA